MKIYGAQLTGSIASTGNPVVTGSLTVSGNLTAQQFIVSSSVTFLTTSFSSGSTKFGDSSDDNHNFTGSVLMTGSLTVVTTGNEFQVNAGGVNIGNALTDNHIISGSVRINPNGLFVSSSGDVGIGTITPLSKLNLYSVTTATQLIITGGDTTNQRLEVTDGTVTNRFGIFGRTNGDVGVIGTQTNHGLVFNTNNTERMRITSAGNVGIGTSSPSDKLQVGLDENAYISIANGGSTDVKSGLRFRVGGGGTVYSAMESAASSSGNGYLSFSTIGSSTLAERMRITSTGNVGIGTTSPSVKLDVNGQIKFNSIATTDYSISFSGIGAGAWFNIPEFNFNGFYGLATISIQNDNSSRGYTVRASAWIFQTGINGLDIYGTLRSVTIRPDGTSYEGLNVVESYHTAPSSGRYNMRMRLVVREAGLGAANPLNLQIWVDNTASFPASGTLLLKAI